MTEPTRARTRRSSSGHLKVFISYARRDHKFVDWLDNNLRSHGLETLVDRKSIENLRTGGSGSNS
jgi:hypothetical protein